MNRWMETVSVVRLSSISPDETIETFSQHSSRPVYIVSRRARVINAVERGVKARELKAGSSFKRGAGGRRGEGFQPRQTFTGNRVTWPLAWPGIPGWKERVLEFRLGHRRRPGNNIRACSARRGKCSLLNSYSVRARARAHTYTVVKCRL